MKEYPHNRVQELCVFWCMRSTESKRCVGRSTTELNQMLKMSTHPEVFDRSIQSQGEGDLPYGNQNALSPHAWGRGLLHKILSLKQQKI